MKTSSVADRTKPRLAQKDLQQSRPSTVARGRQAQYFSPAYKSGRSVQDVRNKLQSADIRDSEAKASWSSIRLIESSDKLITKPTVLAEHDISSEIQA
jgi:hypothetical protein